MSDPHASSGSVQHALGFDDADLLLRLEACGAAEFDAADFGLIVMDRAGQVLFYNTFESQRAGMSPARVVGNNFFTEVGPCTDNPVIAGRFRGEPDLDVRVDYVFTLRMKPTPVRLRLLAASGSARQYLVVQAR